MESRDNSMQDPVISVILPCRNEEKYIGKVLEFFLNARPFNKELLIADGASTDETRSIIAEVSARHPEIILIENPDRFVPFALNKCILRAKGKYVIRLDAHTEYEPDYFEKVIETFERTGAEIVGGPMRATGNTSFQRAVAVCTSTQFGVGDSKFHDDSKEGLTDSVYLGAWKREIFDRVGMFDVNMLRNQDDEFHYRAKSKGMNIYLNPAIASWYYPRSTLKGLMKQYFQYGLYKPLVLSKVKSEIKLRHLIPTAFSLYLISLTFTAPVFGSMAFIPFVLYLFLDVVISFSKQHHIGEKVFSLLIFPALHLSYGTGFLLGLTNATRRFFFKG